MQPLCVSSASCGSALAIADRVALVVVIRHCATSCQLHRRPKALPGDAAAPVASAGREDAGAMDVDAVADQVGKGV